jgi:hypothetical protein
MVLWAQQHAACAMALKENHMKRLPILPGLAVALVLTGWAATIAAAPIPAVTTSLSFFDPSAPQYSQFNLGELRAKFRTTSVANGTWSVEATFKPHSLDHAFYSYMPLGSPLIWLDVSGSASTVVAAAPGNAIQITASGLSCANSNEQFDLNVVCSFTVGTNGVVTVQSISLGT